MWYQIIRRGPVMQRENTRVVNTPNPYILIILILIFFLLFSFIYFHFVVLHSTDHTAEQVVWSVAPNKLIDCVFSSVMVSIVKRHFFIVMLSSGRSENRSGKLVWDIHYILKGLLFHTTADLSITPTCGLLSHFSNCPPGLWCQLFSKFVSLYLAVLC